MTEIGISAFQKSGRCAFALSFVSLCKRISTGKHDEIPHGMQQHNFKMRLKKRKPFPYIGWSANRLNLIICIEQRRDRIEKEYHQKQINIQTAQYIVFSFLTGFRTCFDSDLKSSVTNKGYTQDRTKKDDTEGREEPQKIVDDPIVDKIVKTVFYGIDSGEIYCFEDTGHIYNRRCSDGKDDRQRGFFDTVSEDRVPENRKSRKLINHCQNYDSVIKHPLQKRNCGGWVINGDIGIDVYGNALQQNIDQKGSDNHCQKTELSDIAQHGIFCQYGRRMTLRFFKLICLFHILLRFLYIVLIV